MEEQLSEPRMECMSAPETDPMVKMSEPRSEPSVLLSESRMVYKRKEKRRATQLGENLESLLVLQMGKLMVLLSEPTMVNR